MHEVMGCERGGFGGGGVFMHEVEEIEEIAVACEVFLVLLIHEFSDAQCSSHPLPSFILITNLLHLISDSVK